MSEPFIGEIRPFGFDFAPRGWALCNGQWLSIPHYQALHMIIGTTYGGNSTHFALPDLRGRTVLHRGDIVLGTSAGAEGVALTPDEMPRHDHAIRASTNNATSTDPSGRHLARSRSDTYRNKTDRPVSMHIDMIGLDGSGSPHDNMQPTQTVSFAIAVSGIFPPQN